MQTETKTQTRTAYRDPYRAALETLEHMRKQGLVPCCTITHDPDLGEFCVPCPSGRPAGNYFTDDREDALQTAQHIWGGAVACKIRRTRGAF